MKWRFIEQEGSGYFFEQEDKKTIVTTEIWNHQYIIYTVQNNIVDLSG
jgi:hypothetical protein